MKKEILLILRCPITGATLREMSTSEVEELNQRITRKELSCGVGDSIQQPADSSLISGDGRLLI